MLIQKCKYHTQTYKKYHTQTQTNISNIYVTHSTRILTGTQKDGYIIYAIGQSLQINMYHTAKHSNKNSNIRFQKRNIFQKTNKTV